MPSQDFTKSASYDYVANGSKSTMSISGANGAYKYISSLNAGKPLQPGVYRCNPVTIYTGVGSGVGASFQNAAKTHSISGDILAYCAAISGWTPKGIATKLPAWSNTRQLEAVNKAYAKLMESELEVGTMLGELRETLEGLRNPLSALRKYMKSFITLQRNPTFRIGRELRSLANASSGTWLEFRYGIRPLISDIQSIIDAVNGQISDFDAKMRKRRGKSAETTYRLTGPTSPYYLGGFYVHQTPYFEVKEQYVAKVAFAYTRPLTWQERFGVDIFDLPSIAWELTTLSFVFDWFVDVGSWLQALKAVSPAVNVFGTSVTRRVNVIGNMTSTKVTYGTEPIQGGTLSYDLSLEFMERRCLTPGFQTLMPSLNSTLFGLNRSLDAITLLWQSMPRIRR